MDKKLPFQQLRFRTICWSSTFAAVDFPFCTDKWPWNHCMDDKKNPFDVLGRSRFLLYKNKSKENHLPLQSFSLGSPDDRLLPFPVQYSIYIILFAPPLTHPSFYHFIHTLFLVIYIFQNILFFHILFLQKVIKISVISFWFS